MKFFNKQCCFSVHFTLQVKMLHKFTLFICLMTVLNDVQCGRLSTEMESVELNSQNLTSKVDDIEEAVNLLEDLSLTTLQKRQNILNGLKLAKLVSFLDKFDVSAVFQGRRYLVSHALASFNIRIADFLCEAMGGYLTEIEDKEEYDFLFEILKGVGGDNFFTGANDIDEEGVWTYWHSGKPVTYVNWASGQPDNYKNEDCMEINFELNAFNDRHCTANAKFVCEVPV